MPLRPDRSALHVSQPLTNVSVAYAQNANMFIADKVFPVVGVSKQGDLYYKYSKGDWFRGVAEERAPATESAGGGWEVTTDSYFAKVFAVHKDVDDQTRANADSQFDLDRDATRWCTQQLLLKRELDFISAYMTTGVWGLDRAGVASGPTGTQFLRWDVAGSDPIDIIQDEQLRILSQTGVMANTLVVGPYVLQALLNHAGILDRIKYTQGPAIPTTQLLAQLFGVDRVLVTNAIVNSGAIGAADSFAFASGKSALLVHAAPSAGLMQVSGGYIFAWTGFAGSGAFGIRTKRFRMEAIESDRIESEMAYAMKVVASDTATYFSAAVS